MTATNAHGQSVGDTLDWHGAAPPAPVVLAGRFVTLRPLVAEDAPAVVEALGVHPELWTYLPWDPPTTSAAALATIAGAARPPLGTSFAVESPDGSLLGRLDLMRADPAMGSIEVGAIVYSPALQRTRAATETQLLLAEHAFDTLGYRRYEWKCDSLNAPSRRAALRLGFVEEGTWRQDRIVKGRNRDTTWFSVTDAEWPVVRAAMRAWLADDNVDDAGVQRRSLAAVREGLA
ncbi:GNAT family N-acetyltransferase [Phycicoccus sp. HDW14]|uniref:GNAT family N-acetyltransferase n=1 Tax=Phycicoccus sp. HDW14 TaxID=2714941 RepID=UPI00140CA4E8|nr:GNAT family protein [Phycicoccus sp. HDW14]QIM20838.1 GNAT family N-acetyltransferase [Phycicoccus sp. HDW14]